jgi:hypothetical protein
MEEAGRRGILPAKYEKNVYKRSLWPVYRY